MRIAFYSTFPGAVICSVANQAWLDTWFSDEAAALRDQVVEKLTSKA